MTLEERINKARIDIEISRNLLNSIVTEIERTNVNDNSWMIYSEKVGRKFVRQSTTLNYLLTKGVSDKNESINQFDFSSIFTILRSQFEAHATFYHLFADDCELGEKVLRFRLWQLDGLKTRQGYSLSDEPEIIKKLNIENNAIKEITDGVESLIYFQALDSKSQSFLLKKSAWRFTKESLMNKDYKKRLSINQMILNTGISKSNFDDWYSVTSSHAHSTYPSILHNDDSNYGNLQEIIYIGLMLGNFVNAFFVKDFTKLYPIAQTTYESSSLAEKDTIELYYNRGKSES